MPQHLHPNTSDQQVPIPYRALKTLVCGGVAGAVAKTIIAPFDRVKIHFQVQNPAMVAYSGRISGIFGALRSIYKTTGFLGLYRGHSAMLLRIFPYAAINFYSYEYFKSILYDAKTAESVIWWKRLLAGSLAGAVAVTFTYPLDIIRVRMAYDLAAKPVSDSVTFSTVWGSYRRALSGVVSSLLTEGKARNGSPIAGIYQGYLVTVAGILPYAGVSYLSFESLKMAYRRNKMMASNEPASAALKVPIVLKLGMGMVAGALGQTAAYPLDIVRRRTQIIYIAPHLRETHRSEVAVWKMLRDIIRQKGIRGLFVGLSINYLKVAPATGVSFVVYESMRDKAFHLPVS